MTEDLLLQVRKPARYIGQEWNSTCKDFEKSALKFALCFPDLYEVGMSNLGLRIIYGVLNSLPSVACERFFSPARDMEDILRRNQQEIFSLENKRRLREFDLAGFSLGYELCYTNVLNILDLGGIPLKAVERGNSYPLIIGAGAVVLNPEPLHEFFDLFVIGEGEEVVLEIVEVYRQHQDKFKTGAMRKEELLLIFSHISGVYVPSLYEVKYDAQGKIGEFKPKAQGVPDKVKKRFVKDLDKAFFPLEWVVPYIEIVHDRIILEIMRGCPNQCRFCQARLQYYPFRKRGADNIMHIACQAYQHTGYEEISLMGLSVSDYPQIEGLVDSLVGNFKEKGISISLPSIKPKSNLGRISSVIAKIKKTGLTFAPEAATDRLRAVLNKNFNSAAFFKSLEEAYLSGYQRVKLYFMIGLPDEGQADLDGIADFANQVSYLRKQAGFAPAQVNLSINALIPKPHTPFQWLKMEGVEAITLKQDYLKKKIKNKKIDLNFHNIQMSFLEAVFSRGDRRLSQVVFLAFKKGARFDAWEDYFQFWRWLEAFQEAGLNPEFYLEARSQDEILPWDFLDIGLDKESSACEFNKV